MTSWEMVILYIYEALLCLLSVFAVHRLRLAYAARRSRLDVGARACLDKQLEAAGGTVSAEQWPTVLVQVPLFNEQYVAARVIDAVCKLVYPRERLSIQILDDSTDNTPEIVAAAVAQWQAKGIAVEHVRRGDRKGFKAGALAAGLVRSTAELVAVFDADFVPERNFLCRLVPEFKDPEVGMVQARWEHLNRQESLLTQAQAILLDGHFVNEHGGRFALGHFFNFNGTSGIWRRACIEDAGGWSARTLTEDLDLSYRAQLRGWRFLYRPDVAVPGELPGGASAFKAQQHRWAKGSIEAARHLLPRLWQARDLPLGTRLEATLHLLGNFAYFLVLFLALLMPAALFLRPEAGSLAATLLDLGMFGGTTLSVLLFYWAAEKRIGSPLSTFLHLPAVLALGAGLAINNTRAVLEALLARESAFERTPKFGGREASAVAPSYRLKSTWQAWIEAALGLYLLSAVVLAVVDRRFFAVPFLLMFAAGFLGLGIGSLQPLRRTRKETATANSLTATP